MIRYRGALLEEKSSLSCSYSPAGKQEFKRGHEGGQHLVPLERTVPASSDGLKLVMRHCWNGVWVLIK